MIIQPSQLLTTSLRESSVREAATHVLASSLNAVDPFKAVRQELIVDDGTIHFAGQTYRLDQLKRVFLVGAGKAGYPMAEAVAGMLGARLSGGVVIVKEGYGPPEGGNEIASPGGPIKIIEAGHPIPDQRGQDGTRQIKTLLQNLTEDDLVLAVISGGGSALLTDPVGDATLNDLQLLTSALLSCGARIEVINVLRKHVDSIKGGGLARLAYPATIMTLILSDVIGDPLDAIASGPTVPDPTTFQEAYDILGRYRLIEKTPRSLLSRLERGIQGKVEDTPKSGDPIFETVQNVVVGSNGMAARAAAKTAQTYGFQSMILTTRMQGEARERGKELAGLAQQMVRYVESGKNPLCVIVGGETTVTLRGNGLGGRNQELALSAVPGLSECSNVVFITLATDGGDGPTDAAGAVVTGETLSRAQNLGLDPLTFLDRNDAYHFFEPLGDLLKPGPTLTNVNDLTIVFAW